MKKLIYFLLVAVFFTMSCEEVPVVIPTGSTGGGPIINDTVYKTVLIEDYTGVKCPNCPNATIAIEDIRAIFGKDRVVALGVHGRFLTSPVEPTDTKLSTTFAKKLEDWAAPLSKPAGSINRVGRETANGTAYWTSDIDSWPSLVETELLTPADMTVDFDFEFNETSRTLDVDVTGVGINDIDDGILVSIFLSQNGIIATQETNIGEATIIEDYEHEHVLLDGLTDVKGDAFAPSIIAGEEVEKSFSMVLPDAEEVLWNVDDMDITVFVSTASEDTREVFYVKSKKLK